MITVSLKHDRGTTPIWIGAGALEQRADELRDWCRSRTTFLISSQTVLDLHGERLTRLLADTTRLVALSVPDGEAAKSVEQAAVLWNAMLDNGGKRDSRVLALGGGSVGDLAGFVAGTFLRGIEVVQIPTTLLAQVDASVGGKTGVDLAGGKNTVGVFLQPRAVVADTELLATLPQRELRSGLVEAIKKGAVLDRGLFEATERSIDRLLQKDGHALADVVAAAVRAKAAVVESDPYEKAQRKLLNFGHTLAHAIEAELGYSELKHGEAVAHGMLFALRLGATRGWGGELSDRLPSLLARLEIPELPASLEVEALTSAMARDKKARESGITWVLARSLGVGELVNDLEPALVAAELDTFLADG
jgi:3-dehydroquinate synthase